MAETGAPTLVPEHSSDVNTAVSKSSQTDTLNREKQALFDQLVQEGIDENEVSSNSRWNTLMTGLLWSGYAVAIVVALVLVWSAASGLLKALP
jgi:hypothetical protein